MKKYFIFFILFIIFSFIKSELKETIYNITLDIIDFNNGNEIGKKGAIAFKTYIPDSSIFDDNDKDLENKTKFEALISDFNKNYTINCRLWKSSIYKDPFLFCNFDESIPAGNYSININNTIFNYKEYTISLKTENDFNILKLDLDIIDLYYDKQTINVEKDIDFYELKFRINSYNKEKIILMKELGFFVIDNCTKETNELKCLISKNKLEEIMAKNEENYYLYYLDNNNKLKRFSLVGTIKIKYNDIVKQDIFIGITRLLENVAERDTLIAYETNITDISKVYTILEGFQLKFESIGNRYCAFRKYDNTPLLIVCWTKPGNYSLADIEQKI